MSIFEQIKSSLNLIDVARYYSIEVNRSGFTSCLFHNERTPSLKLYDDHFHCYGCGKSGDVIALVAQRLNVSQFESAKIIMNDFHLLEEELKINATPQIKLSYSEWEWQTIRLLNQYRDYLNLFRQMYAPKTPDEPVQSIFVESIHALPRIEYYLDILTFEPLEVRQAFLKEYVNQLEEIEIKLDEYKRNYPRMGGDSYLMNRYKEKQKGVGIFEE
ncbi:CHC2 zinc finger domain-containing protein [Anaerotignum sp.]|uniref:CHC2 zinc finger domain-containing protein n=1 Tax=Anaerotignum sp. TaxID=2039241 RepID=UPI0028B0D67B|nr:CHC2 zinc finger domain-containing protein [Anaerotignum sp.]